MTQVTTDLTIKRLSSGKKDRWVRMDKKLVINEDIMVVEYSPDVFAFLRERDGFDNDILRDSLRPDANMSAVFRAGESSGKSGSFFFFSQDQNFIIKTMTESDFNAFKRIQRAYFKRVCTDRDSLLARIYGIYSVIMEDKEPVKLVVMGNTMKNATRHLGVFDLKGSLVKRLVKGPITSKTKTLKDKNILALNRENFWLHFKKDDRRRIMKAMIDDVEILRKFNLMDYSLLLCIQENPDYGQVVSQVGQKQAASELIKKFHADGLSSNHKFISRNGKYKGPQTSTSTISGSSTTSKTSACPRKLRTFQRRSFTAT